MRCTFRPGRRRPPPQHKTMSATIQAAIRAEASKLVVRHQTYASTLSEALGRMTRRGVIAPTKILKTPRYWSADRGFDPYHVRANSIRIGHAISQALRRHSYKPKVAVSYDVPKGSGEFRRVQVFQVADNAISRLVYKNLLAKNAKQFNAHCYAYREDLTLHDAVSHIAAEFRSHQRLFLAEFDFSKYFDNISHDFLSRLLDDPRFFITKLERRIIDAFITAPSADVKNYPRQATKRSQGIPQGTSISLFLANLAGFELDRRLERLGVGFARYADDTIIWSNDYSKVCTAVDVLGEAGAEMGVQINPAKSEGIHVLAPHPETAEFRSKSFATFVGHRISQKTIGIGAKTVGRAKAEIAQIVYRNLLEGPETGRVVEGRVVPPIDDDYVTMIYQIRRYLYGGLNEKKLGRFLARTVPVLHYKGFMSAYPLVNDATQLKQLDGWLLHTVFTSLRRRTKLLRSIGPGTLGEPHGMRELKLISLVTTARNGSPLDLRLPSFYRIARLFLKATRQFGASAVSSSEPGQYYFA